MPVPRFVSQTALRKIIHIDCAACSPTLFIVRKIRAGRGIRAVCVRGGSLVCWASQVKGGY
ncbi:MAG TPA: hypothetical protein DIC61_16680 [Pseudomonas sp.]|nr:hypothetical protein [Pseudomonas sp.]